VDFTKLLSPVIVAGDSSYAQIREFIGAQGYGCTMRGGGFPPQQSLRVFAFYIDGTMVRYATMFRPGSTDRLFLETTLRGICEKTAQVLLEEGSFVGSSSDAEWKVANLLAAYAPLEVKSVPNEIRDVLRESRIYTIVPVSPGDFKTSYRINELDLSMFGIKHNSIVMALQSPIFDHLRF
jgi:hypothetical protein